MSTSHVDCLQWHDLCFPAFGDLDGAFQHQQCDRIASQGGKTRWPRAMQGGKSSGRGRQQLRCDLATQPPCWHGGTSFTRQTCKYIFRAINLFCNATTNGHHYRFLRAPPLPRPPWFLSPRCTGWLAMSAHHVTQAHHIPCTKGRCSDLQQGGGGCQTRCDLRHLRSWIGTGACQAYVLQLQAIAADNTVEMMVDHMVDHMEWTALTACPSQVLQTNGPGCSPLPTCSTLLLLLLFLLLLLLLR